mmetsp:Transcript_11343/g.24506  ORF Transcript_11343/g.24506 Transcript_11343/m.24506 type:complete len:562 (+) Transcript_11343:239-1924(+)
MSSRVTAAGEESEEERIEEIGGEGDKQDTDDGGGEEDNDDEGEEEEEAAMLGFAVPAPNPSALWRNQFPSKMGGEPAWLDPVHLPLACQLTCQATRRPMRFVLQLYAASSDEPHAFHRSLYLFISPSGSRVASAGGARAFRCQLPRDNAYYPYEPPMAGEKPRALTTDETQIVQRRCAFWARSVTRGHDSSGGEREGACVDTVETAPDAMTVAATSVVTESAAVETTGAKTAELAGACTGSGNGTEAAASTAEAEKRESTEYPQSYPEYELIVEPEPEEADGEGEREVERLMSELKQRGALPTIGTGNAADSVKGLLADATPDSVTKSVTKSADGEEAVAAADMLGAVKEDPNLSEFTAFSQRLARAPRQCLRYAEATDADCALGESQQPLWASRRGRAPCPVPACELCGGPRRFEFQVMPQALHYMKVDSEKDDSPDWATIAVYTCAASCRLRPSTGSRLASTAALAPPTTATAATATGSTVTIVNLNARADLNNKQATVRQWHAESGRWVVQLHEAAGEGESVRVRPDNLIIAGAEPTATLDAAEGGYVEEYVWVQPQE